VAVAETSGLHGFPAVLTIFIGRNSAVRNVAGLLDEERLASGTRLGAGGALT
jgi:hypothetical protein